MFSIIFIGTRSNSYQGCRRPITNIGLWPIPDRYVNIFNSKEISWTKSVTSWAGQMLLPEEQKVSKHRCRSVILGLGKCVRSKWISTPTVRANLFCLVWLDWGWVEQFNHGILWDYLLNCNYGIYLGCHWENWRILWAVHQQATLEAGRWFHHPSLVSGDARHPAPGS